MVQTSCVPLRDGSAGDSSFGSGEDVRQRPDGSLSKRIDGALASATIVLPVIGLDWLRIADENGRR
jgi:hypothetical protein